MASSMFPTAGLQVLIASVHFLGVTILTFFFSRRLLGEDLNSKQALARLTWARICVLLVFLDSYFFVFSSGLLVFGVGLQKNTTTCAVGICLCISFYTSSKVLIYAFLTEKVYMVWDTGRSRFRSPVYLVCAVTVLLYLGIVICMIWGRIGEFRQRDGACVIGLKPTASIPLLSYDLYINILLTGLFMWPLLRSTHSSVRLRRVATRTLVASGAALTTSTVNIAVLTVLKGRELGWVCLASCATDVIFNAAAIFWVTSGASPASHNNSGATRSNTNVVCTFNPENSVTPSPARSIFKLENKQATFKMKDFTPTTKEFQIHVTTEVSTSPPTDSPAKSDAPPNMK
ncbi:hypothetical protein DFH07DRAFT_944191 [Mycena maculata]|uniref:Transmembrane protein n=1 Tax=Mycena maculata TaxID=230809 RepID=A0AAD7I9I0_9AGAR|nr:hypothetical protein DFH07DRAFT_944191 [Mycena maculata]